MTLGFLASESEPRAAGSGRAARGASGRVGAEWARRVEVEYRSAALTLEVTLWATQAGLSPDLIRDGMRVVDDELAHAELAHAVARAAGATVPVIDRARLALPRAAGEPLEHDLARACAGMLCLGETVAVPIFRALRERCSVAVARRALDRVLRDEVRHRDFGWALLGALVERPPLKALVERELPSLIAGLRATYASGSGGAPNAAERAWGLMAPRDYPPIVERALAREIRPRLARLGVEARTAAGTAAGTGTGTGAGTETGARAVRAARAPGRRSARSRRSARR